MSDEEYEHIHALTAFVVIVAPDGKAFAVLEPPPGVVVDAMPDTTAVRRACHEIVDDINAQITAEYVGQRLVPKPEPLPADRVADKLVERLGTHSADAHLAHQFDDGVEDWRR